MICSLVSCTLIQDISSSCKQIRLRLFTTTTTTKKNTLVVRHHQECNTSISLFIYIEIYLFLYLCIGLHAAAAIIKSNILFSINKAEEHSFTQASSEKSLFYKQAVVRLSSTAILKRRQKCLGTLYSPMCSLHLNTVGGMHYSIAVLTPFMRRRPALGSDPPAHQCHSYCLKSTETERSLSHTALLSFPLAQSS